ncbi:MAG: YqgE/AlgH family protein [Acidobacteriota bacterium]
MMAMIVMLLVLVLSGVQGYTEPVLAKPNPSLPQKSVTPEKGVFLVASSDLTDPNFRHSVVLLLSHGEDGTLGLILNRVLPIPLSEVLPDVEGSDRESKGLFFGGPVGLNGLLFLIRSDTLPELATQVMEEVYFSGDRELLQELLQQDQDSHTLRVYVGRAGWAPGQLAEEIAEGSWGLVQGDPETVFEKDSDDIWRDLTGPSEPSRFIVGDGMNPALFPSGRLPNHLYQEVEGRGRDIFSEVQSISFQKNF